MSGRGASAWISIWCFPKRIDRVLDGKWIGQDSNLHSDVNTSIPSRSLTHNTTLPALLFPFSMPSLHRHALANLRLQVPLSCSVFTCPCPTTSNVDQPEPSFSSAPSETSCLVLSYSSAPSHSLEYVIGYTKSEVLELRSNWNKKAQWWWHANIFILETLDL